MCVWKNVFISVNKYTYIYILYIYEIIYSSHVGGIFFIIYPYVYIYNMGAMYGWSVTQHAVMIWFSLFRMLYHFRFRFYTILNCTRWFFYYLWSCFYVFLRKKIQLLIWDRSCLLNTVIIIKCKKLKNV